MKKQQIWLEILQYSYCNSERSKSSESITLQLKCSSNRRTYIVIIRSHTIIFDSVKIVTYLNIRFCLINKQYNLLYVINLIIIYNKPYSCRATLPFEFVVFSSLFLPSLIFSSLLFAFLACFDESLSELQRGCSCAEKKWSRNSVFR